MTQRSLFWDGEALGDCGPYASSHLHDQFFRCILGATGDRGVVRGWRDELLVSGASSPLSVSAGGAVVYGLPFDSDAAVSVAIPTPSAGTSRYDRVVAQRDWATQTIRIARVSGVAAPLPVVPALTQTAGTIYQIPLATVLVTSGGVITLTDTRQYCAFPNEWPAASILAGMYEQGAVTAAKRPDRTRYEFKGGGAIRGDSEAPFVRAAGADYDYWEADFWPVVAGWVYFMGPTGMVGATVNIYLWTVPDVNGAGGGAENARWDYSAWVGADGGALTNTTGTVNIDQQARVNTTPYRDQLIAGLALGEGQILALKVSRNGPLDSYRSAMRVLGVEMEWTADA